MASHQICQSPQVTAKIEKTKENKHLKTDFTTQKAMDMGYNSRKGFDSAVCEIIFLADAYNN